MHATEFVARYIEAWNQQDSQAIANHLSESGTYLDVPIHQQLSREQLIKHLDEQFRVEDYSYELSGEVCSGENTISFQYIAIPRSSSKQTTQNDAWFGAEFITLQAGSALEIADYYEQRGTAMPESPIADAAGSHRVKRYAKSGLSASQMNGVKQQLEALMQVDKIYLQPNLTLPELADKMNCSVNHLSQVINAGFGVSFFDYLNKYRIGEAMHLLDPQDPRQPTVLSVALQVGFNSTSTFYVAFKKVTGKTPAQYRRQLSR